MLAAHPAQSVSLTNDSYEPVFLVSQKHKAQPVQSNSNGLFFHPFVNQKITVSQLTQKSLTNRIGIIFHNSSPHLFSPCLYVIIFLWKMDSLTKSKTKSVWNCLKVRKEKYSLIKLFFFFFSLWSKNNYKKKT